MTQSAESSVGVVVDGVPQGATASGLMLDLARVEVLRGPQGTLFGKNASAGVLNMATQAPMIGDRRQRAVRVQGHLRRAVRATANLPINDISALRVSGIAERNEGVLPQRPHGQGQRHRQRRRCACATCSSRTATWPST
jgi:iron complex outermembrane receptor protein